MKKTNWAEVKNILQSAIEKPPGLREKYISERCVGDDSLRREIDELLNSSNEVGSFMENGAIENVAEMFDSDEKELKPSEILSHYKIIELLGEGGMGKVYLAIDLELERPVALKVLRSGLSWDIKAKMRLVREARAAAKLDHPNICSIHEIDEAEGHSFIVLQYIEGKTLAETLETSNLTVDESLKIAIQIADAIEEAHSHGIIHRDIKSSNIIINEKGQAKVLDFGLAKFIESKFQEKPEEASSPGLVIGTVPYMSPEQLRGKVLDTRTDIFSFGAVLFEMLTGRQPFSGENQADTIFAILNEEPDMSLIPAEFHQCVARCLMKDKNKRYQTVNHLVRDLRQISRIIGPGLKGQNKSGELSGNGDLVVARGSNSVVKSAEQDDTVRSFYSWKSSKLEARTAPITRSLPGRHATKLLFSLINRHVFFLAGLLVFIAVGAVSWLIWQSITARTPNSHDALRPVRLFSWKNESGTFYSDSRASHTGKMIAYSSTQDSANDAIYVKQIPDGPNIRVTRDEWRNLSPVWSPDDQRIAYASFRNGKFGIYMIVFPGGDPTLVKTIGEGSVSLRHWSNDGSSIFYELDGNLFKLDLSTANATQITDFEPSSSTLRYFSFSPGEDQIAYSNAVDNQPDIWMKRLNGGTPRRLTNDMFAEIRPIWHSDGKRILYTVIRDKHYQINLAHSDGGDPEQITRGENEYEIIDVSVDGGKIFYLTWENRSDVWGLNVESGEEIEIATGMESEFWPDISPDGKSILYQSNSVPFPMPFLSESQIVVKTIGSDHVQLSINGYNPRWLPDSQRIAFLRWNGSARKYYLWIADSVNGDEKQVSNNSISPPVTAILPYNRAQICEFDWRRDSTEVVYLSKESGISNILLSSVNTSETVNYTNNSDPNMSFYCPLWSPDGNKIAYVSSKKNDDAQANPLYSIWIVENGKPRQVYSTFSSLRLLGWSPSGKDLILESVDGIIGSKPLDVRLLNVTITGRSEFLAEFKNIYATSMTLGPDRKTVAFTEREADKDNIRTESMSGGKNGKVTSNGNSKLFFGSLRWSPDGKIVFFDKQETINAISMLENFK